MAEIDITPELLERVQEAFAEGVKNNKALTSAAGQINLGRGSFEKAERYAEEIGNELAKAFRAVLTDDVLPNGRLYYNIADRVVRPMLAAGYIDVQQVTGKLIEQLNSAEGIGLKAVIPEIDQERIQGIIDAASSQETVKESMKYLGEPVVNLQQHAVDDMVEQNAKFQYQAGTNPKIRRTAEAKCCKWCSSLGGTYDYPVKNRDVYRRHENCRCLVEYIPGKGKRQDVWSKRWKDEEIKTDIIQAEVKEFDTSAIRNSDVHNETVDVIREYRVNASPGSGSVIIQEGVNEILHVREIEVAQHIHNIFGGDIEVLLESNGEGIKTADYLWHGHFWDLKTTTTAKSADSAIRKGLKQIAEKPGGIILDFENRRFSMEQLLTVISRRIGRCRTVHADIMIFSNGHPVKILRYNK